MVDVSSIKPEANSLVIIHSDHDDGLEGIADAICQAHPSVTVLYLRRDESIEVIDLVTAKTILESLLAHSE